MAYSYLEPTFYHAKCGERIETVVFADRMGGKRYCPKHPDLEEYAVYRHKFLALNTQP